MSGVYDEAIAEVEQRIRDDEAELKRLKEARTVNESWELIRLRRWFANLPMAMTQKTMHKFQELRKQRDSWRSRALKAESSGNRHANATTEREFELLKARYQQACAERDAWAQRHQELEWKCAAKEK